MYVYLKQNKTDKVTLIFHREVIEITKEMIMALQKRNPATRPSLAIIQVN